MDKDRKPGLENKNLGELFDLRFPKIQEGSSLGLDEKNLDKVVEMKKLKNGIVVKVKRKDK